MLIPTRRFAWIEASLLLFILLAGATTAVTKARYFAQRRAFDQARVARPVLRVCRISESADLGILAPGSAVEFEFTIDNGSIGNGFSEVSLEYEMAVHAQSPEQLPWILSLHWLDRDGIAHSCTEAGNGKFSGFEPLTPSPISHRYRLGIALPADASLSDQAGAHEFEMIVTASQRNG